MYELFKFFNVFSCWFCIWFLVSEYSSGYWLMDCSRRNGSCSSGVVGFVLGLFPIIGRVGCRCVHLYLLGLGYTCCVNYLAVDSIPQNLKNNCV